MLSDQVPRHFKLRYGRDNCAINSSSACCLNAIYGVGDSDFLHFTGLVTHGLSSCVNVCLVCWS